MLEALTGISSATRVVKLIPNHQCRIDELHVLLTLLRHSKSDFVRHQYESVIQTAEKMVKAANLLQVPCIVTEQNPKALGATVPLPLSTLPNTLYKGAIPKTKFSMFLPEVEAQLKEWKTKSVVIFGIESHVCVLQTCLDLLERDYSVHILADGVSSCNQGEVGIAIARMQASGAQITTSESALFQLMVDSSHPAFRQVSGLVKETKSTTTSSLEALVQGKGKL